MSNFIRRTRNPVTGQFEDAVWLDDFFGPHCHGVQFPPDPTVHSDLAYEWEFGDVVAQAEVKRDG
jgi:hypothetical protein